jgi:hypothetical protein
MVGPRNRRQSALTRTVLAHWAGVGRRGRLARGPGSLPLPWLSHTEPHTKHYYYYPEKEGALGEWVAKKCPNLKGWVEP